VPPKKKKTKKPPNPSERYRGDNQKNLLKHLLKKEKQHTRKGDNI
jgi:hypothetical protein